MPDGIPAALSITGLRKVYRGGVTALSNHYLHEAETLCNEIALIAAGRIVDRGSATSLRNRYHARDIAEVYDRVITAEAAP
jgi:ABC-2 type transport system ATP-binding protein